MSTSNASPYNSVNMLGEVAERVSDPAGKVKRTPGEQCRLNQLSEAHMNSQNLKPLVLNLSRYAHILCLYIIDFSLVFLWDTGVCIYVGLWFLFLGSFPFLFWLFQLGHDGLCFILLHLLCHILLSLRSIFFLMWAKREYIWVGGECFRKWQE